MFGKITLIALLGAIAVSADQVSHLLTRSEHSPLFARQLTAAQIPAACQSQCTSALSIYQACTTGDTTTCLTVCQPTNFQAFTGCLQCVLSNTPGVTSAQTSALNQVLGQLATACGAAGSPVSSSALVAGASGSATASGVSASASSVVASVTGTSSRVSSISTGAIASVTSAISQSASSVIAASSSRAAGDAIAPIPKGLQAVALGLVGVVAGAALVL